LLISKDISNPPVPLALPTQSTLLRGVCFIENKKATYLLSDAIDAKTRLQQINRRLPKVNLPEKKLAAPHEAIALDENELGPQHELPDVDTVEDLERMLEATLDERELGPLEAVAIDESSLGLSLDRGLDGMGRQRRRRGAEEAESLQLGEQDLELNINLEDGLGLQLPDMNLDLPDIARVLEEAKSVLPEPASPGASTVSHDTVSPVMAAAAGRGRERAVQEESLEASGLDFDTVVPEALEENAEGAQRQEPSSPRSVGSKRQRRRKIAIADSTVELTDEQIREFLHDADELLVLRPVMERKREDVSALSLLPGFAVEGTEGIAPELLELYEEILKPRHAARKRTREEAEERAVEEEEEAEEARREAAKRARMGEREGGAEAGPEYKEEIPMPLSPGLPELRGLVDFAPFDFDAASVAESVVSFGRASRGSMEQVRASEGSRAGLDSAARRPSIFDEMEEEAPAAPRRPRTVPVEESPDVQKQPLDVSLSQFELSYEEIKEPLRRMSPVPGLPPISSEGVRIARKFRRLLEDAFSALGEEEPEALRLEETIAARAGGLPTRLDMVRAFMQVLVLKTQDVIEVEQARPFEDIIITKGPRWHANLTGIPSSGNTSPLSHS